MRVIDANDREQQQTSGYDTDGRESTITLVGGEARSHAQWSGSDLVIDSVLATGGSIFHVRDYWSLSPDGQTLTMAHRDDGLAGQTAVFDKAPTGTGFRRLPQ